MKKWSGFVVVAIFFATLAFGPAAAQDDSQATIEALQTEVADLKLLLTPTAKPTVEPASSEDVAALGVYGPMVELLEPGRADSLSIVARGKYQQGSVAVVVRNNTTKTFRTIEINGDVRDAEGKVTQTVTGFQFYPSPIAPGGLILGQLYFDQPINQGDEVKIKVKGQEASSFDLGAFPMEMIEFNVLDDGRVTGSVRNQSDKTTTNRGYTILLCFDEGDTPVWSETGSVEDGLAPGKVAAFEFGQFGGIPVACDRYLFSAYSYNS